MKLPWKKEVEEEDSPETPSPITEKHVAKIDKLEAYISFLMESKKVDTEKIARLAEHIGELRSSIAEREKDIKNIEKDALKSIELVKEVQPEKLLLKVEKEGVKIEKVSAKLESYEKITNSIIKEIKNIRIKIHAFRGAEEIVKLHQEVREEHTAIKRISAETDISTNKVEKLFTSFHKEYLELKTIKERSEKLELIFTDIRKEFDNMQIKISELSKIQEVMDIQTEKIKYHDEIKMLFAEKEDLKKMHQEIKEIWRLIKGTASKTEEHKDKMEKLLVDSQKRHIRFQDSLSNFQKNYQDIKKTNKSQGEVQVVKDYIHHAIINKVPKEDIKNALLGQGWTEEIINKYL